MARAVRAGPDGGLLARARRAGGDRRFCLRRLLLEAHPGRHRGRRGPGRPGHRGARLRLAGGCRGSGRLGPSMDSLHTIGFYAASAVALVGAVLVAVLPGRGTRAAALLLAGVGVAGIEVSLSAGFTAGVVLLTFAGCAALIARHDYRSFDFPTSFLWRQ